MSDHTGTLVPDRFYPYLAQWRCSCGASGGGFAKQHLSMEWHAAHVAAEAAATQVADDDERPPESDAERLDRINRWVHAAGHEYGTLIDDIVGIHSAKGPDGKVQILGLTDVTWLLVHAKSALQCEVSRHDLARIIQSHVFRASRPWPDGTQPTAPDWNPGCSCGEGMYWSQWDLHVADQILAATTSESNER